MYEPFVRACNYALEELSDIRDIDGLPEFSEKKRIVFALNYDRSVHSEDHQRESQTKPDVVLLQWEIYVQLQKPYKPKSFSDSYEGDIRVQMSNLSWRKTRSTVEMKFAGLPKLQEWAKNFDVGVEALKELPADAPLDDAPGPNVLLEAYPDNLCERASLRGFPFASLICLADPVRSSSRFAESKGEATTEGHETVVHKKRTRATRSDSTSIAGSSKRTKAGDSGHEDGSGQNTGGGGKGSGRGPEPRPIGMMNRASVQNATYAAERLSCSLDITHSLNFILYGEIRLSGSPCITIRSAFDVQGAHCT